MSQEESLLRIPVQELRSLSRSLTPKKTHVPYEDFIVVSSATKRVAFAYERFRNVLEPDEEDILRRKAIWRILNRRIDEDRSSESVATSLLQELIRANYIQPVPVSEVAVVARYIEKARQVVGSVKNETADWILMMCAVSIDRELYPRRLEEAFVQFMYKDTYVRAAWATDLLPHADRASQLYIACHKSLFAADDSEIMYHFFINSFPFWREGQFTEADILTLIKEADGEYKKMQAMLSNPARDRIFRLIRPVAVPYRMLWDMLQQDREEIWQSEQAFEAAAREVIESRTKHIENRMSKRAWHSVLFLFFTKTILAIFIELPYELFLLGGIHYLGLAANILFHPLLLFFASTTVRMPGVTNTEKIVDQMKRITLGKGELQTVALDAARHYGPTTWTLFGFFYTLLFLFIFWRLFLLLDRLDFTLLGMMFFVFFLGLVSFLAVRIRRSVDDIRVIQKREGAISLLVSFFSLPVLELGRWLTSHIRQLNVVLFVMDLVLEAPFKILIDVTEEWFAFVKDRKEEIV